MDFVAFWTFFRLEIAIYLPHLAYMLHLRVLSCKKYKWNLGRPVVLAFFTMCDGFNHGALQIAVAQICQSMGWDALQKSTHDLLTDVLQKYLEEIAKSAHGYCQLCKV